MWSQEFLFNMFLCFLLDSPTPCALKVADKIAEQFDNPVLLMVRKTEVKLFYRLSLTCWFNLDIFLLLVSRLSEIS